MSKIIDFSRFCTKVPLTIFSLRLRLVRFDPTVTDPLLSSGSDVEQTDEAGDKTAMISKGKVHPLSAGRQSCTGCLYPCSHITHSHITHSQLSHRKQVVRKYSIHL